jgi:hypothetical protein
MFTLELDLIITYIPPMSETGGGIHVSASRYGRTTFATRSIFAIS